MKVLLPNFHRYLFVLFTALYLTIYKLGYHLVFAAVGARESEVNAFNFVKLVYYYGKRQQILGYLTHSVLLFTALLIFNAFIVENQRIRRWYENASKATLASILAAVLLLSAATYAINSTESLEYFPTPGKYLLGLLVIGTFLLGKKLDGPFALLERGGAFTQTESARRLGRWALGLFFIAMTAIYFGLYLPSLLGNLAFPNEYLNISTRVLVDNREVSTLETVNSIPNLGLRIGDAKNIDLKIHRPHLPVSEAEAARTLAQEFPNSIYYDEFMKVIVSMSRINETMAQRISELLHPDPSALQEFIATTEQREKAKESPISTENARFMEKFSPTLLMQVMSRWYLHHHNFQYGPTGKLMYGFDWKKIFFQYGLVGGAIHGFATKLFYGDFTLKGYFTIFPICFLIYYFIFVGGLFWLTRSATLVVGGATLLVALLFSTRFEYITMGPGLSPLRHFFDLFVLIGLAKYVRDGQVKILAITFLLAAFNLSFNTEFGAFCLAGLLFGICLHWLTRSKMPKNSELAIFAISCLLMLALWKVLRLGTDSAVSLYVGGWWSPVSNHRRVLQYFMLVFGVGMILAMKAKNFPREKYIVFMSSLVYGVLIGSYVLWGTGWHHFVGVSSILLIPSVLLWDLVRESIPRPAVRDLFTTSVLVVSVLLLGASYLRKRVPTENEYRQMLSMSPTAAWKTKGAEILTAIPEAPFADSLELIQKYEKSNSLVMISKFDNLLLILNRSFNALPGNEIMTYMMSPIERGFVVETFKKLSPRYIFADCDILAPTVDELIDPNLQLIGPFHAESYMRTERINNLKTLFKELATDYRLVETGGLLSVWEKKP